MQISEILTQYPEEDLHRLARDKVDEVANLRLPREVLSQEIAAALSSLSYVARVLAVSAHDLFQQRPRVRADSLSVSRGSDLRHHPRRGRIRVGAGGRGARSCGGFAGSPGRSPGLRH